MREAKRENCPRHSRNATNGAVEHANMSVRAPDSNPKSHHMRNSNTDPVQPTDIPLLYGHASLFPYPTEFCTIMATPGRSIHGSPATRHSTMSSVAKVILGFAALCKALGPGSRRMEYQPGTIC